MLENLEPEPKSVFAVKHHLWDWQDFNDILGEMEEFAVEHEMFRNNVENGPEIWADAFFALKKPRPHLTDDEDLEEDHHIDKFLMNEAVELDSFKRLNRYTKGDPIASAQSVIPLREPLEEIWDKLQKQKELAEELQELMQQMAALQSGSQEDQDGKSVEDLLNELKEEITEVEQQLSDEKLQNSTMIKATLDKEFDEQSEAQEFEQMIEQWGTEKGKGASLDPAKRLELAEHMNNPQFKKMAELVGALRLIMRASRKGRTVNNEEEIVDLTSGNNLSNLIITEFSKLRNPKTKLLFYKEFRDQALQQIELKGTDYLGRGEIVCCIDTSMSMGQDRDAWAKAVGISLLNIAKKEKRGFYGVHFGSSGELMEFDFGKIARFGIDAVTKFISHKFHGGTNFSDPLDHCIRRFEQENARTGEVRGDIVFITDGECRVTQEWMDKFKATQRRLEFNVWGILVLNTNASDVDEHEKLGLYDLCEGNIFTLKDLVQ